MGTLVTMIRHVAAGAALKSAARDVAPTQSAHAAYKTGESFFEPPGSRHLVSENASAKEPASLLAIFVADNGARLTTFDQ